MKKTLSMILALIMLLSMLSVCVYAQDMSKDQISRTDIQLLTSDFVLANIAENPDCTWNTNMQAMETPLFNTDDSIVAYYVAFDNIDGTPNGYLVINASAQNPSVLEYAFGTAHDDLVPYGRTYYATLGDYFTKDELSRSKTRALSEGKQSLNIENIWDTMSTINYSAQARLSALRSYASENVSVLNEINSRSTNLWGISTSLPSGTWTSNDVLTNCALGVDYYTTELFEDNHDNHCGATAAINVLKYYGVRLNYNLVVPGVASAFDYLYTNTGNGRATYPPKLISALNSYISNRKNAGTLSSSVSITTEQYTEYGTYRSRMVSCINNGKMPLLMIWSTQGAHWVNVVAYYTYSNGNTYVRIIDNWNPDINHYYVFESGYVFNENIGGMVSAKITK